MKIDNVILEIINERDHQDTLRRNGRFAFTCADTTLGDNTKLAILAEEFGEVARLCCELNTRLHPEVTLVKVLEMRRELKRELTQTAAVCVAWLESCED